MLKSSTHGSLQNGVLGIENKLERNTINQWTQICTCLWKSHRVNLPQNKTMVHCATMIKKLPTAFRRNGVVISTNTASEWCVDDGETHENAHQYVSSPLQVVVTKCEDPLRQFHHSKDGVLVTSTCNASEWCMTHVESHGTHDNPHLDQSWTNQHPNGHWSALCERKRRNSTVNSFSVATIPS